jgi:tRNA(His) 5'-end guanylyltransferase
MDDDLGDRMKLYEGMEAGRRLMPRLPCVARIDGRSFSTFARDLAKPYDPRLSRLMIETTRHLVRESNARIGYTQSDEITLVLYTDNPKEQLWFDRRVQKMTSQLAAQATAAFNHLLPEYLPEKFARRSLASLPTFDARVWSVPTLAEAANVILWREQDATRNSVESAARAQYSHNALMNRNTREMRAMLRDKGIDWDDYPALFKRGTYIQRRVTHRRFSTEELEALPPKHAARTNPELTVERTDYVEFVMPPFGRVQNREAVVFFGEDPVTLDDATAATDDTTRGGAATPMRVPPLSDPASD